MARVLEDLVQRRVSLVTNSYVLSETMGLVQHRIGYARLQEFMDGIGVVTVIYVTERHQQAGWARVQQVGARHFTIVDATSVVMAAELGITECVGLDAEFERQGLKLLPRP